MSSSAQSLKQRGPQAAPTKKKVASPNADGIAEQTNDYLSHIQKETKIAVSNEWDYKLALGIITLLAFATRFYGITHPNQVVFDEVHFGKVRVHHQ